MEACSQNTDAIMDTLYSGMTESTVDNLKSLL